MEQRGAAAEALAKAEALVADAHERVETCEGKVAHVRAALSLQPSASPADSRPPVCEEVVGQTEALFTNFDAGKVSAAQVREFVFANFLRQVPSGRPQDQSWTGDEDEYPDLYADSDVVYGGPPCSANRPSARAEPYSRSGG